MSPRPRQPTDAPKLTPEQRQWLEHGDKFIASEDDAIPFPSSSAARQAWEAHGERITLEYRRQRPGKRPDAWWRFDAPEGRERYKPWSVMGDQPEELSDLPLEAANLAELGELTEEERLHLASTSKDPGPTSR